MNKSQHNTLKPLILAPAGNRASFLAALAAGADAVYCGLKDFSARMETKNFSVEELAPLTRLAHDKGVKVYVTFNSLLKPAEPDVAGRLIEQLGKLVKPDALIIQDLAFVELARQTGYTGELHLSTLANVSFPAALKLIRKELGVNRVVVPRELSIDEIKAMASACPKGLDLEVFVHGALCYGVSGRCYWSSYLGGKSGLRGRCVQPCRRRYTQDGQPGRFFSCQDLSLDVLVKVLLSVPEVRAWKIEGRKKGPHYVFHTVQAYRMLRDQGGDPQVKKTAIELLDHALGRTGTHYNFLPQRPQNPVKIDTQTGSGLLVGTIKGTRDKPFMVAGEELLPGDILRIGYEDEPWHGKNNIKRYVPPKGRLFLKFLAKDRPVKGTPVFLTDRREKALEDMITKLEGELGKISSPVKAVSTFNARLLKRSAKRSLAVELRVYRKLDTKKPQDQTGLWLSIKEQIPISKGLATRLWWWLPPVIWPDDEPKIKELVNLILNKGGQNFVLNAPWQTALFPVPKGLNLWAGPFCNPANPLAVQSLASLGFNGVIVSPELGREDILVLPKHSPLPVGIVISGNWPLCVSRVISENLKTDQPVTSPKGEQAWVRKYDSDFWVYPNWKLDIRADQDLLQKAGYSLFVHLIEPLPKEMNLKKRPGLWNWELNLQ
ncbi:MAG: peptidase U32 family protein [Pseudomonadota bacterium]|uniref:U32 family peptidase n=1 Tax=Candidatus Desulfatibia profunda TaxID=2841695 RepID=A0A8J6TJ29_9BACT|nr:U32 family peptidase [Candidatus Desulfatibia profunda]